MADGTAHLVVDGIELTIEQTGDTVTVSRIIGRDRTKRPPRDITGGVQFGLVNTADPPAIMLANKMKAVSQYQTARCTCGYRYGYSDHAEQCQSIYVATYDGGNIDDD